MDKKALLDAVSTLVEIECVRKKTNKSQLSIKLGRNRNYLNNMFNKNESIDISVICEIATCLECEPNKLIPNLDFLKTLN